MITIMEYAILSNRVYKSEKNLDNGMPISNIKNGKSIRDGWACVTDVSNNVKPSNNFYAQLYLYFQEGKPRRGVIAYRGTDNLGNYETDAKSWYKSILEGKHATDNIPEHDLNLATTFYWQAVKYTAHYFPELDHGLINVTGHSLGGALAQFLPSRYFFAARAITFNAPGIATMPGVCEDMWGRIYGVEARYDFVSKVGESIGRIYYVDVPNEEEKAKEAFKNTDQIEQMAQSVNKTDYISPYEMGQQLRTKEDIAFDDFYDSVVAQHAMAHMVAALNKPENSKIANTIVP